MCSGCHGVTRGRSAHAGTGISTTIITRNAHTGRRDERQPDPADHAQRLAQPRSGGAWSSVARDRGGAARSQRVTSPTRITRYPTTTMSKSRCSKARGHAGREDQHAGDLHEHEQPVHDVVVVVRRREPGEVHPRPPDGEEHEHVARPPRCPAWPSAIPRGAAATPPGRPPPRSRGRRAAPAASTRGAPRRRHATPSVDARCGSLAGRASARR